MVLEVGVAGWFATVQPPCGDRRSGLRAVTSDAGWRRAGCSHMSLRSCGGTGQGQQDPEVIEMADDKEAAWRGRVN